MCIFENTLEESFGILMKEKAETQKLMHTQKEAVIRVKPVMGS